WLSAGKVNAAALPFGFKSADPRFAFKSIAGPQVVSLPSWVLYTSSPTLEQETRDVAEMVKGLERGIKLVKNDKELARRLLREHFRFSDDNARQFVEVTSLIAPDTIRPNVKELSETAELMRSIGFIKQTPTVADSATLERIF